MTAESSRRRIVRRTLLALAGTVLLVVSYVLSFGTSGWYLGRQKATNRLGTYEFGIDSRLFAPLHIYMHSDLPGATAIYEFRTWCLLNGAVEEKYVPWNRIYDGRWLSEEESQEKDSIE